MSTDEWVTRGINCLIRGHEAIVPKRAVVPLQVAALDELGLATKAFGKPTRAGLRRIVRA